MDHKEQQEQEIEALESIFPTEFELLKKEPLASLAFDLKTPDYDSDPFNGAKVRLVFTYTPKYPDEAPEFSIESSVNVTDESELSEFILNIANENLGMPMLYTVVIALLEKIQTDNENRIQQEEDRKNKAEKEKEAEEMRRFDGTKVSVESFLRWKVKFDAEMNDLKFKVVETGNKKLTGKQLFELDDKLAESDLQLIGQDEDNIEVDEALFQDLEQLDVDDFDGDDDEDFNPDDCEEEDDDEE